MKLEEATQEELVYLQLWGEFWEKTLNTKEGKQTADRQQELVRAWYRENNMEAPEKSSPYCLMFYSFVAGIRTALELPEEEVEP